MKMRSRWTLERTNTHTHTHTRFTHSTLPENYSQTHTHTHTHTHTLLQTLAGTKTVHLKDVQGRRWSWEMKLILCCRAKKPSLSLLSGQPSGEDEDLCTQFMYTFLYTYHETVQDALQHLSKDLLRIVQCWKRLSDSLFIISPLCFWSSSV